MNEWKVEGVRVRTQRRGAGSDSMSYGLCAMHVTCEEGVAQPTRKGPTLHGTIVICVLS